MPSVSEIDKYKMMKKPRAENINSKIKEREHQGGEGEDGKGASKSSLATLDTIRCLTSSSYHRVSKGRPYLSHVCIKVEIGVVMDNTKSCKKFIVQIIFIKERNDFSFRKRVRKDGRVQLHIILSIDLKICECFKGISS